MPMKHGDLGPQERAVLAAIAADPFVTQSQIATSLGLARSTVGAHVMALVTKGYILGRGTVLPAAGRIVCLGGAVMDRKYLLADPVKMGTSNPAVGKRGFGGVARNVCENLARLGIETALASIVGPDETGRALIDQLCGLGVDTTAMVQRHGGSTAEYAAILAPDSSLLVGIADMEIFDDLDVSFLDHAWPTLAAANWVFADCNASARLIELLLLRRRSARFKLAIDAVSVPKSLRLPADLTDLDLLFLNIDEARAYLGDHTLTPHSAARALRRRGPENLVLTLGNSGALVATGAGTSHCPTVPATPIDVTGAGDALIAGTLFGLHSGRRLVEAVQIGCLLAAVTTESHASVHHELSPELLDRSLSRLAPFTGVHHAP